MRPGGGEVSKDVLAELVTALDLVILERLPGGAFFQLGDQPPPKWFVETFRDVDRRQPVTLLQAFPVLDSFLSEAEVFWERNIDGHLDGEAFVVSGAGGENLPLGAVAVVLKGRRFLLLQRVATFADRQQILQRARERALEHEEVVKRIDTLRQPAAALARLTGELREMELADGARKHVASITTELEALRQALDRLPQMPRGASAARPRPK